MLIQKLCFLTKIFRWSVQSHRAKRCHICHCSKFWPRTHCRTRDQGQLGRYNAIDLKPLCSAFTAIGRLCRVKIIDSAYAYPPPRIGPIINIDQSPRYVFLVEGGKWLKRRIENAQKTRLPNSPLHLSDSPSYLIR